MAASGTGTVDMTVTPASYGFGSVKNGSKAVKVIVVHNYQTNPVSLSEGFSGPNAGGFQRHGRHLHIDAGENVGLYADRDLRSDRGGRRIGDHDGYRQPRPAQSVRYPVSFTALATIPESVSPTSLHYANVYQTASKTLSVTVTNKASSGPITLTGTSIGGANAGDFAVTGGNCPMPVGRWRRRRAALTR